MHGKDRPDRALWPPTFYDAITYYRHSNGAVFVYLGSRDAPCYVNPGDAPRTECPTVYKATSVANPSWEDVTRTLVPGDGLDATVAGTDAEWWMFDSTEGFLLSEDFYEVSSLRLGRGANANPTRGIFVRDLTAD